MRSLSSQSLLTVHVPARRRPGVEGGLGGGHKGRQWARGRNANVWHSCALLLRGVLLRTTTSRQTPSDFPAPPRQPQPGGGTVGGGGGRGCGQLLPVMAVRLPAGAHERQQLTAPAVPGAER